MSENLEPGLSPREAAAVVYNRRTGNDAPEHVDTAQPKQNDEESTYYGKEGVERSQGYEPMEVARPYKEVDAEPIDSTSVTNALHAQEAQTASPFPIQYYEQGGKHAGRQMDRRLTVSAEQAAHDLGSYRQASAESEQAELDRVIAEAIDELRADAQPQQVPPDVQQQQTPQPEAQAQPQQEAVPGVDPEIQRLLEQNPKLLSAVVELQSQAQNAQNYYAQEASRAMEAAQQQYHQGLANNANVLLANFQARFPELRVPMENWQAVIQSLAQSNPQRAEQISGEIRQTRDFFTQAIQQEQVRVQALAQQEYQRQTQARRDFDTAAKNADHDFDAYAKMQVSSEQLTDIQREANLMMREYGLSEQEVAWHWQNNPAFRSLPAQKMMFDAARWRLAQRGISEKISRPVPTVQPPTSPAARGSEEDFNLRRLNDRLNATGSPKDAAALLVARRGRR
jgi:hypothetical protein